MPISVSELFESADLSFFGPVSWGHRIKDDRPGVYVVSLSSSPNIKGYIGYEVAPIDLDRVQRWILKVPELKLDGSSPTTEALKERLSKFWFPDEVILYIGRATSIKSRVRSFYRTELGMCRPHSGGHWIKTLFILDELSLFWGWADDPKSMESKLLEIFVNQVSERTRLALQDPDNPFPFANLEHPKGNVKKHGIKHSVNREY